MKKEASPKLVIFDGNALFHRSFHALPLSLQSKGKGPTNAVYGFSAVLLKACRELKPTYAAIAFDCPEETFRHKKYKLYKANRPAMATELAEQIPLIKRVARVFGLFLLEKPGYEADDIIGSLVAQTENQDLEKIIVTGDLDALQLVGKKTKVFSLSRGLQEGVVYDEKKVKERFGLRPEQIVDYKALRGDPSDNIPGVAGIGEKTATQLLQKFQTLENIYAALDKGDKSISPRVAKLLREQKEQAFLSKELAQIKKDVPLNFSLAEAKFQPQREKIEKVFLELGFRSLLPRLADLPGQETKDKFQRNLQEFNYHLVATEKDFADFYQRLSQQKRFSFDAETNYFSPLQAKLIGLSFSWKEKEAYYLPFSLEKGLFPLNGPSLGKKHLEKLKAIFQDKNKEKVGHNVKYDYQVLANYGIEVKNLYFDTRLASYLLNPDSRAHNLDYLSFYYFHHQKITKKDLFAAREKVQFQNLPQEKIYNYSCEDADFTWRLAKRLEKDLEKHNLAKLFFTLEMPLIPVLAKMERHGIKVDVQFLKKKSQEFSQRLAKITQKAHALAGEPFNLNSPVQLRKILFEKLKLPTQGIKKGKTGYSTSAESLEKLRTAHPLIALLQEARELEKLKNTYLDALPKLVDPQTGRLHTIFNQTGTATGRLSSSQPNLQNIPVRTKEGKEIRKAFCAEKDCLLLSLDYSQIELRLAAHFSGDEKLRKAFFQGKDIHQQTAAEIKGIPLEKVTPELRQQAKAINFGILYGQGPHGLAQSAGISYERAQEFIQLYFAAFPGVKKYIERTIAQAREKGYVETLFGRRRYLPEINSSSAVLRKAAERMAINAPLQGTAADLIKAAMLKIQKKIEKDFPQIKMVLQIHDELIFEAPKKDILTPAREFQKIMENIYPLEVPIVVTKRAGKNWGELKSLD